MATTESLRRQAQELTADTITKRVVNSAAEAVKNRDEGNIVRVKDKAEPASLRPFKLDGTVLTLADLETEMDAMLLEAQGKLKHLSKTEQQYIGMILPGIMQALVLDERYTNKIYAEDMRSLGRIALQWAMYPDSMDQTHIRVGYGGDTRVSGIGPAYLSAPLELLSRIKEVFDDQRNYALINELMNVEGTDKTKRDEIRKWLDEEMLPYAKRDANGQPVLVFNKLLGANVPPDISGDVVTRILEEGWRKFHKAPTDMDTLKAKYHFPDQGKSPQLYVFNASHAAIRINGMDHDTTMHVRGFTQKLLKGYIEEYHPEFVNALHFQDDRPWTEWESYTHREEDMYDDEEVQTWNGEHNQPRAYTKLLVRYNYELTDQLNGLKGKAEDTLAGFGEHHAQRGRAEQFLGMEGHQIYGAGLHEGFFYERSRKERNERFPRSMVMDSVPEPENILYYQGPPEEVFGVMRKLIGEHRTLSKFINWLEGKRDAGVLAQMAHDIQKIADDAAGMNGKKPYRAHLGEAITIYFKQKDAEITEKKAEPDVSDTLLAKLEAERKKLPALKGQLIGQLRASSFKDSPSEREGWQSFIAGLGLFRDEEVFAALQYAQSHQTALSRFLYDMYQDDSRDSLYESPVATVALTSNESVEQTTAVGRLPVYYIKEGVDAVLWPNQELPSLSVYQDHYREMTDRSVKIKGTTGLGVRTAEEYHKHMGEELLLVEPGAKVDVSLAPPLDENERRAEEARLAGYQSIIDTSVEELIALIEKTYEMEQRQVDKEVIVKHARDSVAYVGERLIKRVEAQLEETRTDRTPEPSLTITQQASAAVFKDKLLLRVCTQAKDVMGKQNNINLEQAAGRLVDYTAILRDINPLAFRQAEKAALERAQTVKGVRQKSKAVDAVTIFAEICPEDVKDAETSYQTFLKKISEKHGQIKKKESVVVFRSMYDFVNEHGASTAA